MKLAKVFKTGRSQAVRIPKEFQFHLGEIAIAKIGDAVILYPPNSGWDIMERGIKGFTDDFMSQRNQPKNQERRKKVD
jgi:antitoxin VapB